MHSSINTLSLAHSFISANVRKGAYCIDATCGRGRDTVLLAELAGADGKVLAFDIQPEAIEATGKLVSEKGLTNVTAILDSHENMDKYAGEEEIDAVMFNFGWLPGGNHDIFSTGETSVRAISKGLRLLKQGGVMTLCIYYGRNNGYAERDAILEYIKTIDQFEYTVIKSEFVNRRGEPPIAVFIIRG